MFTKNFYNSLVASTIPTVSHGLKTVNRDGSFRNVNDMSKELYATNTAYRPTPRVLYSNGFGTAFGNGTAEPTFDDIDLSGERMTNVTGTADTTVDVDESGTTLTTLYTLTNTGDEDFTISEIGLFAGTSDTKSASWMVERTLLDIPVTIQAGGIGQVTYTIRVNYPTA